VCFKSCNGPGKESTGLSDAGASGPPPSAERVRGTQTDDISPHSPVQPPQIFMGGNDDSVEMAAPPDGRFAVDPPWPENDESGPPPDEGPSLDERTADGPDEVRDAIYCSVS
jgi:hypothetical protein